MEREVNCGGIGREDADDGIEGAGSSGFLSARLRARASRVARLVDASELPFDKRQLIHDNIVSVLHASNGVRDRMQALTEALLLSVLLQAEEIVVQRGVFDERVRKAKETHDATCPLNEKGVNRLYGWFILLRWPAAVVLCAAMVTNNLDKILDAFAPFL